MTNQTNHKKPLLKRIIRIALKSALWFFAITIVWVLAYKWLNPPTTFLHLTCDCPDGQTFHKEWVDGEDISIYMKLAVVASEDNNFMKHGGIDWGAVEKAKKYNETIGKKKGKTRGASTISQQTAKNVFLWPGRNYVRKALEVYFTYLIEWIWGKERIMEVYLNVIETGPCKFGVEAAAKDYFRINAKNLSKEEAALIAACLPNPNKYSVAKPGPYMQKRKGQIVRLMGLIGTDYFDRYQKATSAEEREMKEKIIRKKLEELPEEDIPIKEDGAPDDDEPTPAPVDSGGVEGEETAPMEGEK